MNRLTLAVAMVLGACTGGDDAAAPAGATSSGSGSDGVSSAPATSASGSGVTTAPSMDAGSTATDPTTSGGTSSGGSSTTAAPEQACGLPDLKPGEPDPIVAGDAAMEIPTDISAILLASCGCHLADDFTVDGVPDYPSTAAFDMTTWSGWHAERRADSMPYHAIALNYLETEFMPLSTFCNVDGEAMDPADRATMIDWLTQSAPDGATWTP